MNKMIFIFNIILIFSSVLLISADYSYKNADDWKNDYPQCGGSKQSPIDIETYVMNTKWLSANQRIKFDNYDTLPEKMILKNDGHTLKGIYEWASDEELIPHIYGGLLESEYNLHSIQFRWGADINFGNEHQTSSKGYSMEMQVVHLESNFDSYEEAEEAEGGLLIYSLFFRVGSEESEFLTKITEKISDVLQPETETEIEPFSANIVYEKTDARILLIYDGSLTHPPCTESVIWMISNKVFNATTEQLQLFHTLELLNGDDHNNRPLQAVNDREVKYTRQFYDIPDF